MYIHTYVSLPQRNCYCQVWVSRLVSASASAYLRSLRGLISRRIVPGKNAPELIYGRGNLGLRPFMGCNELLS